jgi:hypothetical protein
MPKGCLAIAVFSAFGAFALSAAAEDEFDVKVSGRQVTVTAKGDWHINPDYPWKLVVTVASDRTTTVPKSAFELAEKRASVASKTGGEAVLKGAVCIQTREQNACRQFSKSVKLQ